MRVALVNTNRIRPPIAPIGLDYLAEALAAAGHSPEILDLCWEDDPPAAIAAFFARSDYGLTGVSLRNSEDCAYPDNQSFLPSFAAAIEAIREHSSAPIVAGGVGFSIVPEEALAVSQADAGVWGEGEFVLPELASRVERGREWRDLPNLIVRCNGGWKRNPPAMPPLDGLPPMRRRWVDNPRYFREGGQAGFETKRGCSCQCVYCADPLAKGTETRVRPPSAVADEVASLLEQGIDHLHTCDGEFNLPVWHALEVCREFARRGFGGRLRWYAYCSPALFSRELARAMRDAGCVGINFGADNGDAEMLRRLGRGFAPSDILNAARWAREAGMAVMLDLLLGSPGESRESLVRTIELVKHSAADRIGVSAGARVYPGTALARRLGCCEPTFLEPEVAPFIFELLDNLIGDDRRFLFFDPTRTDRNYNYNANQRLVDAIGQGYRGAYWDILRRWSGNHDE